MWAANAGILANLEGMVEPMTQQWTPERTGALIALWNDEIPASEIGRRLGVSKNAVIGKAFRLDLARRRTSAPPSMGDGADAESARDNVIRLSSLQSGMCRWPLGEPHGDGYHFCGAAASEGKPYCPTHCDMAYRPTLKARKSAAVG
jgi:GcrA cell cycle regulator